MARFDIHVNPGQKHHNIPCPVDVQSNVIEYLRGIGRCTLQRHSAGGGLKGEASLSGLDNVGQ
jgi:hypothetical protein